MAKPKIPNQKNEYNKLNKRLASYVAKVRLIIEQLNEEATSIALSSGYNASDDKPFSFSRFPKTKKRIKALQKTYVANLSGLVYSGITDEWRRSNIAQDLIANNVLKTYTNVVNKEKYTRYYQKNSEVLKAFKERKQNGLSLSEKLWKQSIEYRKGVEASLSMTLQNGIEKGLSAVTLSKRVSKYLQDYDKLRGDYKKKYGKAIDIKDCHYESARLARSEINMAYRTAEQTRWQQMDFVVGYEIKLSKRHHHTMPHGDICDDLAGKYPKNFKWTGWHPNDMCYVVPILKTEDEFWNKDDSSKSVNEVTDVPDRFKKWVENNIQRAKSWSKSPFFIRDNGDYVREDFKVNIYDAQEKSFVRKGRTELAMSRIEFYKKIYPEIPEVRLAAINAYTQTIKEGNKGATYREINKRLRNGNLTEYVDVASDLMSKGLSKLPKYIGKVYRCTHLSKKKYKELYLDQLGGIIEEKAFTSSSPLKEASIKFLSYEGIPQNNVKIFFEIHSKNGRDISKISEFNGIFTEVNQYEVLFDKGTKFRFLKPPVEIDGIINIILEEI